MTIPAAYAVPDPDAGVIIWGPAGAIARALYPDGTADYITGTWLPLTSEEAATVAAWQTAQAMPLTIEERLTALEAVVFGTPTTPGIIPATGTDILDWVPPTGAHDAIEPGGARRFPDGSVWWNISGGWLVHPPDVYPPGWELLTPPPEPDPEPEPPSIPAWTDAGSPTYTVGDRVTDAGNIYRCIQTHTAHQGGGWRPFIVPSLWTKETQ